MAYSGRYKFKEPSKYDGNPTKVVYRSLWERQCFKWCESQDAVKKWHSEETVIPYICGTDKKVHRYFMDLKIIWQDGSVTLVEIKPKKQTIKPDFKGRRTRKYISESMTYVKNQSKWNATREYCLNRGWKFEIWTEDTLKAMGLRICK